MFGVRRNDLMWLLLEEVRLEKERIAREIKLRAHLRRIQNPLDVGEADFMKRYRLSKDGFYYLRDLLAQTLRGSQRVTLEHKILCALSFYAQGSYQKCIGEGKNFGQSTICIYINEVTDAINLLSNRFIKFPTTREERNIIKQKFFAKFGFPGVIGCIDGSHFHIFTPNRDVEHAYYCRKNFYSLNVQMICDSDCHIINVNAKYGGATHDAYIWQHSRVNEYMQDLHHNFNESAWLLGDSGYPTRPWLMTLITDAPEGSPEHRYTSIHGRARVVIEHTFGRLKNRWRCLNKCRTLHYSPPKCAKIIMACAILHNLAIMLGLPDPIEDQEDVGNRHNEYVRREVLAENVGNDLLQGRAIRAQLVERIGRLH